MASFKMPDVVVDTEDPLLTLFASENIPQDASITLKIFSPQADVIEFNPMFVSVDSENVSKWSADVTFPLGFSRGFLQATWDSNQQPASPYVVCGEAERKNECISVGIIFQTFHF